MKIALVKQDVYSDLYVHGRDASPEELLMSSIGRSGPIGLFTMYDTDFYIVKEENTKECHVWKKIIPHMSKEFLKLKTETIDKVKGMDFQISPTGKGHADFSVSCDSIDWEQYDIVISINCSIPTRIVHKYPKILWAYMIGEANFLQDRVYFGYDVSLNQKIEGNYDRANGIIDFPYTFVGPDCLEKIMEKRLGRTAIKQGIYGEINTTTERPVKRIPQFEPISEATGQPIKVHKQIIGENMQEIFDSKYYLKVGGRKTRGNGAIEAISLGTVALLSPDDIICTQILPPESWVMDAEDAIQKIKFLDSHPEEYAKLLEKQRSLVKQFVVDYPMHYLLEAAKTKKGPNRYVNYSNLKYGTDIAKKVVRRYKLRKRK